MNSSKINQDGLRTNIADMMSQRKQRKFKETVELQIGLKDYDPEKDKRFQGSIKLPNIPKPRMSICIIGNAIHCGQAKDLSLPHIDVDGLKKFNKDRKLIKKYFKKYDTLVASEALMKQIPRLLGNVLVKMGKFPVQITDSEKVTDKVNEVKATVRFQLKKVLCMGTAVATVEHSPEQIRQNINMSINFLVSLLKKGWQNIRTLHIKTSMGKSQRIYG